MKSIIERTWKRVMRHDVEGKTITVKIKFFDFEVISRSRTTEKYFDSKEMFIQEATEIFMNETPLPKPVRLIGVTLSNFRGEDNSPVQSMLNF